MPTEEQLREIHRLALLGGEAAIAQDVTSRLAGPWLRVSRFRAVRDLSRQTLQLGPTPITLTYLARDLRVLGDVHEALRLYGEALHMYDEAWDRAGLAMTATTDNSPPRESSSTNRFRPMKLMAFTVVGGCDKARRPSTHRSCDGASHERLSDA